MQEVQICGPTINPSDWKARSRKELLILQACCYALPFLFACVQRTQCEPLSIRVYSGASTERSGSELGMEGTKMMWTSRTEVEVLGGISCTTRIRRMSRCSLFVRRSTLFNVCCFSSLCCNGRLSTDDYTACFILACRRRLQLSPALRVS